MSYLVSNHIGQTAAVGQGRPLEHSLVFSRHCWIQGLPVCSWGHFRWMGSVCSDQGPTRLGSMCKRAQARCNGRQGSSHNLGIAVTWELLKGTEFRAAPQNSGCSSPDVSNISSSLRFFAPGVFEVKPQLNLGWKHLSREGEASEGLAEVGFPPVF